jgi:PAS domain S-box-containing protein
VGKENKLITQHSIYEHFTEGFILAELILKEKRFIGYRILEFGSSNEKQTGLKRELVLGRRVGEYFDWFGYAESEILINVVLSGMPAKFEKYCEVLGRWSEVQVYSLHKGNQFIAVFADITERKNADKVYQTIFNSMDEAFCIIEMIFDSEGKPVDWRYLQSNPAHEIFRMHDVKGKLISMLAPKTEKHWFDIYGNVALTGETVRFVAKAGKRSYDIYAFKIGGQDSRKVAVLAYDITERKSSEEKLTFQANLLSSVHDAVCAFDENENFTYWNKMSEKLFGWSAQEVIGQSVEKLFPRNNYNSRVKALAKLVDEGYFIGELEYPRKDGVLISTDTHIKTLVKQNREYKGAVCSFRDITERKQEEEELKAVKKSLAAEVEALIKLHSLSNRFILKDNLKNIYGEILDAAIVLTQADKGSLNIYNQQNDCLEILEHRGYETHFLNHFKHIQIGERTSGKAFKRRKRIIVDDVARTTIYIETDRKALLNAGVQALQATPLISSSGNDVGILITLYTTLHQFEERELRMLDLLARQAADAIERIRAEETIHQSEKRAHTLVEELRKMDRNKNQFLSMLSHELRNPLASIMMSISLLDRVTPGGEQFGQAKEIIDRQTVQLSRLVDDLLDVTRITQNKINLKKETVNLNELISRALADYQEQLASKGVRLEVELTPVPLHMEADPARLTQVIGNLINNAAKFTAMGDTVLVSVWKDEDQQEAVICVKDNGLGIKPDVLPDLFLPFIQVDSSLDRSSGGLGLGLAIVKGMAELHGGSAAAASEGLGKGAQFIIRLPLPAISKNNLVKQPQPDGKLSRTLRILVIDDIPDVAEIICSLLRLLGHEAISANSGSEGIVKAKAFNPEILFCDIGMPGMNGYEVAESFHRYKELKDIFLVALTGYAQPDDLEQARAAGFDLHLAKPVDITILEQTLAEVSFHNNCT